MNTTSETSFFSKVRSTTLSLSKYSTSSGKKESPSFSILPMKSPPIFVVSQNAEKSRNWQIFPVKPASFVSFKRKSLALFPIGNDRVCGHVFVQHLLSDSVGHLAY